MLGLGKEKTKETGGGSEWKRGEIFFFFFCKSEKRGNGKCSLIELRMKVSKLKKKKKIQQGFLFLFFFYFLVYFFFF